MKSKNFLLKIGTILLLLIGTMLFTSFRQIKNRDLLVGRWLFVRFDWPNFVKPNDPIIAQSNNQFKDMIYIFTKNKIITQQKNGPKEANQEMVYTFSKDNKYIQVKGENIAEIDFLDENYLKLYVQGFDPVGVFKRIK